MLSMVMYLCLAASSSHAEVIVRSARGVGYSNDFGYVCEKDDGSYVTFLNGKGVDNLFSCTVEYFSPTPDGWNINAQENPSTFTLRNPDLYNVTR